MLSLLKHVPSSLVGVNPSSENCSKFQKNTLVVTQWGIGVLHIENFHLLVIFQKKQVGQYS